MAIKRDIAEKLMSGKGNLNGSSFSVIPDGYLGLVENSSGRHLAGKIRMEQGMEGRRI